MTGTAPLPRARVMLAKVGLDGHDRGIKIIARLLRQQGHEIIYLGRRQTIAAVVAAAIDEDVDVLGLSILSGTHRDIVEALVTEVANQQAEVALVVGGTILRSEIPDIEALGVDAVFPVGTPLQQVTEWFAKAPARRSAV